jgi:hypothetical protein
MKEKLKKLTSAPKKVATHVYDHRGTYGVVAGIIIGGKIMRSLEDETLKEARAFIKLKGLEDEFFNPQLHDWQDMV